jgi:hypothetical protein
LDWRENVGVAGGLRSAGGGGVGAVWLPFQRGGSLTTGGVRSFLDAAGCGGEKPFDENLYFRKKASAWWR